jgi:flagellar basal-body rod protein FlgG
MDGLSIAASGLRATLIRQEIAANNVANVNTPAFKRLRGDQATFSGGGTRIAGTSTDASQGPFEIAQGAFDLGIEGEGFFQVQTSGGIRFTRVGVFGMNGQGELVTPQGFRLVPPVRIPAGAAGFEVSAGGAIRARFTDGSSRQVGEIRLARVSNVQGLSREGKNLYRISPASGGPREGTPGVGGFGRLVTGVLEGSNIDMVRETVDQIRNLRTFQIQAESVRVQDEMLGTLVDIRK